MKLLGGAIVLCSKATIVSLNKGVVASHAGVGKEVVVRKHMVVITSPPDARYSPSGSLNRRRQLFQEVRALVIPVIPDRTGTKFPVLPQVHCLLLLTSARGAELDNIYIHEITLKSLNSSGHASIP